MNIFGYSGNSPFRCHMFTFSLRLSWLKLLPQSICAPGILSVRELFSVHSERVMGHLSTVAINTPRIIVGDFNSIISLDEKRGGRDVDMSGTIDFQDFITHNGLI